MIVGNVNQAKAQLVSAFAISLSQFATGSIARREAGFDSRANGCFNKLADARGASERLRRGFGHGAGDVHWWLLDFAATRSGSSSRG